RTAGATGVAFEFQQSSRNVPALRFLQEFRSLAETPQDAGSFTFSLSQIEAALHRRRQRADEQSAIVPQEDEPAASPILVNEVDLRSARRRFYRLALEYGSALNIERELGATTRSKRVASDLYVIPRTVTEEVLAGIWSEVLKLDRVGVRDNFFELGGHSLLAMRVMARLRDAFQIELPLRALFEAPSVEELAVRVDAERRAGPGMQTPLLTRQPRGDVLPLSHAQERLWFIHQHVEGQETAYNMPVALRLVGPLSVQALEAAFTALIARHEVLRTVFSADGDGTPSQVIADSMVVTLPVIEVSAEEGKRYARAHARERFDLITGPLLKAALLRQGVDDYLLLVNIHHIVSDGWSMGVMFRDLQQFYKAALTGAASPLAPLAVQYADYAVWQRKHDLAAHLPYWTAALAGYEEGLALPYDHPRPVGLLWQAKTFRYRYPTALVEAVSRLSQAVQGTVFMTLLTALSVVLHRYSGRTDLCIGTTVAGREHLQLEDLIGFFINILPLRLDLSGDPTGLELLARVRGTALDGFEHQTLPFEHLLTALRLHRDTSQTALVPVMARHQNVPPASLEAWRGGLEVHRLPAELQTAKCELDFQFFGEGLELSVLVDYAADLFDRETIERLLLHHEQVLEELVASPDRRLSDYSVLSKAEHDLLLHEWTATDRYFDEGLSIPELFERQVARAPEALACISEAGALSYEELNESANRVAHALRALGVGPEIRVGLYLARCTDFLVGLLGVFKAGGAYVPLDPGHPPAYVRQILADASPQVVVTTSALGQHLGDSGVVLLDLASVGSCPATNLPAMLRPDHLAYVTYTSGSTGRPKGVMVPHRQILNWLYALWDRMPFGADEMVAQRTTVGFVVSVKELLAGLLAGAPQIILSDEVVKDAFAFATALGRWRVTRLNIVPSHLEALLSALGPATEVLSSLRYCVTAGEPLTQALCEKARLLLPWVELWNNYGCTELNDVAYCSAGQREGGGLFVPIGRPIANTRIYVLDAALRLVPVGVTGELCVETGGAARGYWGQPGLTAERFVPNPYSAHPGTRLYRTGDMVRYLADGRLDYLGREDFEVKIRGHRIDLRQVERALVDYPGIVQAVVQGWSAAEDAAQLVAYYVASGDVGTTAFALREHLSDRLPGFMVPNLYVALEALPRLANGKLDRLALPAPDLSGLEGGEYVAPRTPVEEIVVEIFADLLKLERIGVHDNFFELGGHSLLAMRLIARIRDAFRIELPLRTLFEAPNVGELATRVDTAQREGLGLVAPALLAQPRGDVLPLSYEQERLWLLEQIEGLGSAYNIPAVVRLLGRVDVAALEACFCELARRHESLRTRFEAEDGVPRQVIDEPEGFVLGIVDLANIAEPREREAEGRRHVGMEASRAFDLRHGPLFRVKLLRLGAEEHVVVVVMHHIVSDGWSIGVLIREVGALYTAFAAGRASPLPALAVQYADYAMWQRGWLQGEVLERQVSYWREHLNGAPAALDLPTDRPRPAVQSYRGAHHGF
ncbi:MAG: hypothetical protein QOF94_172, partial [Acidobacteriaceae bacterium]